jgi:hypothetical protein
VVVPCPDLIFETDGWAIVAQSRQQKCRHVLLYGVAFAHTDLPWVAGNGP